MADARVEAPALRIDRVVLATTNRGKLGDFQRLFAGTGIELVLPAAHGPVLAVEETGDTFVANALLKARAYAALLDLPVLADDSGLAVDALDGAPGIFSARFAGPQCDDHANNLAVIERLRGRRDRGAAFVCALVLALPDGSEIAAEGECRGLIGDAERGTNGFGYDSIFFREDLGCTFGEAPPAEKDARSHRAAAVRELLAKLRERGLLPSLPRE